MTPKDTAVREEITRARELGFEVVGFDAEFGVWVQGESGAHPLVDDPDYQDAVRG